MINGHGLTPPPPSPAHPFLKGRGIDLTKNPEKGGSGKIAEGLGGS